MIPLIDFDSIMLLIDGKFARIELAALFGTKNHMHDVGNILIIANL